MKNLCAFTIELLSQRPSPAIIRVPSLARGRPNEASKFAEIMVGYLCSAEGSINCIRVREARFAYQFLWR
jgi:hypothetical protein